MGSKRENRSRSAGTPPTSARGKRPSSCSRTGGRRPSTKTGIFLHAGPGEITSGFTIWKRRGRNSSRRSRPSRADRHGKDHNALPPLARLPGKVSDMIGDDGGIFGHDGNYTAFEIGGLYVKTEGLERVSRRSSGQPGPGTPSWKTWRSPSTLTCRISRTSARPVTPGHRHAEKPRNRQQGAPRRQIDRIIMLSRNPMLNVVSKLTPEQATMQFIYGESIESTGGNPEEAGSFMRVFFSTLSLRGSP